MDKITLIYFTSNKVLAGILRIGMGTNRGKLVQVPESSHSTKLVWEVQDIGTFGS